MRLHTPPFSAATRGPLSDAVCATMWRPGAAAPDVSDTPGTLESTHLTYNAAGGQSFQAQRRALPIAAYRSTILYAVETHQVVILVGETGCGKTTREWLACGNCMCQPAHAPSSPPPWHLPAPQKCPNSCMKQGGLRVVAPLPVRSPAE